jgi:hypothetical protein
MLFISYLTISNLKMEKLLYEILNHIFHSTDKVQGSVILNEVESIVPN